MKKSIITICCILGLFMPAFSQGSGPVPKSNGIGFNIIAPLKGQGFDFNEHIKLLDTAFSYIMCGEDTVASTTGLIVENYTGYKANYSWLGFDYDDRLLPLGKDYVLYVAPNSITYCDSDVPNEEYTVAFSLPANLGPIRKYHEETPYIEKVSEKIPFNYYLDFNWHIETAPVGDPYFILYKEEEQIATFPAFVGWDFGLGYAEPVVTEEMVFDQDVDYYLVLPAGSVKSIYRDDVINEEAVVHFLGGKKPEEPMWNYFIEGTRWDQKTDYIDFNGPSISFESFNSCYLLEKDERNVGPHRYLMYGGKEPLNTPILYILSDEDKVYFKKTDVPEENSEWLLLYDFTLKAGDECDVYHPFHNNTVFKTHYYCNEVVENNPEYGGLTTYTISEFETCPDDPFSYTIWIKGIGDVRGVLMNAYVGWDGDSSSTLTEVTHNRNVIYKATSASVEAGITENIIDVQIVGKTLYINSTQENLPVSVFSVDGKKVAECVTKDNQTIISLPYSGIYIVKAGSQSKKVIAP